MQGIVYGCFLKWWYPTTMGFPTKNDHFGVFGGYHHLRKHPYTLQLNPLFPGDCHFGRSRFPMYTSKNLNDWCILEVFPYKTTLVLLGKNFWASVRFSPMCANGSNFETGSSASHEYFLGFRLLIPCGNVKVQQLQCGDIVRFSINEYVRILFNTWLVSGWTNPFQKY